MSAAFWRTLAPRVDALTAPAAALPFKPMLLDTGGAFAGRIAQATPAVALVSSDSVYFHRFAKSYVQGWQAHGSSNSDGPTWRIHFHLVEPDQECRVQVAARGASDHGDRRGPAG